LIWSGGPGPCGKPAVFPCVRVDSLDMDAALLGKPNSGGSNESHHSPRSWFSVGAESRLDPAPLAALQPGRSRGPLAELSAAVFSVLLTGINAVTFGSLCFKTPCLEGATPPSGVTVWILGCATTQIAVCVFSGLRFGQSHVTLEMLPIVHAIFEGIAASMPSASGEQVLATCLATCFLGTLLLGFLLALGGFLGAARWLRAAPIVVLKGALFGISIFLLQSGVQSSVTATHDGLLDVWQHWAISVAVGSLLFFISTVTSSPMAILGVLLLVAATPTLGTCVWDLSLEELREGDWLLPAPAVQGRPMPWYEELGSVYAAAFPQVSWGVVLQHTPVLLGFWLTHVLCALVDLKAIELITRTELDLDRELKTLGLANIVSVLTGCGWPVYLLCSQNCSVHKLGGRTSLIGWVKVVLTVPLLVYVGEVVPCLPRALSGSVAWWLGMTFMKESALDILLQHSHGVDVFIVLSMAVLTVYVGLLDGILVGFVLAMSAFTLQYSGLAPVVRTSEDASFLHSNAVRTLAETAAIERLGHRIAVLQLEGYIMFGSSPQLTDAVKPLLQPGGPGWVLLSFRHVRGLDYSAVCDLAALGRKAGECHCSLVITDLRDPVMRTIRRSRIVLQEIDVSSAGDAATPRPSWSSPSVGAKCSVTGLCHIVRYEPALKWCEDGLIAAASACRMPHRPSGVQEYDALEMLSGTFGDFISDFESLRTLLSLFEHAEYQPGSTVYTAGAPSEFFVGVVEGELHSLCPVTSKGYQTQLMEVVGVGAFVGFLSCLSGLTFIHTVVVPDDGVPCKCVIMRFSGFQALSEQQPQLANGMMRGFLRRAAYEWRHHSRMAAQH